MTTNQGIPPETITDEVSGIQVANRDREVWDRAILFAGNNFKNFLERFAISNIVPEPPSRTVVQAGAELIDNAMKDLLNHGCKEVYSDYLTIGMIEKWLSSDKGAAYLAALVEAIRTAR